MLNHTIRIINEHFNDGLDQLIEQQVEVAEVITELRSGYFGETGITKEKIQQLANKLDKLVIAGGHLFIKANFEDIGKLIEGMKDTCFNFHNILVVPLKEKKDEHKHCTCKVNKFWKADEVYIAFFTHGRGRQFNFTTLLDDELTNQYPANWQGCFKGTLVEAYEILMKITCGHHDIILDPFMFDAAVGEAAINADRHYIGIEGSHLYKKCYTRLNELGE